MYRQLRASLVRGGVSGHIYLEGLKYFALAMSNSLENRDASWVEVLQELAKSSLDQGRGALLLADIPRLLRAKGFDVLQILQGRKLRAAIEYEGVGHIRPVAKEDDPLVWGIVPEEYIDDLDQEELFPDRKAEDSGIPTFHKAFWAAFIKDIDENYERYVTAAGPILFRDFPAGQPPDFAGLKVDRKYVVDPAAEEDFSEAVYRSITEWTKQNDVQLTRFHWTPRTSKKPGVPLEQRLKWVKKIACLPSGELARISIPLDIVAKLFEAPDDKYE